MKKVVMLVSKIIFDYKQLKWIILIVEEALHALDRYRLFGRELEVEFARGDRKSKFDDCV